MQQKILKIKGMSCAACARTVENSVGKLDGVVSAAVNLVSEKLDVKFDENVTDIADIIEAVRKAGYDVDEEPDDSRKFLCMFRACLALHAQTPLKRQ